MGGRCGEDAVAYLGLLPRGSLPACLWQCCHDWTAANVGHPTGVKRLEVCS